MGDRHRLVLEMAGAKPGTARARARRALSETLGHDQAKLAKALKEAYLRGWISSGEETAGLTASGMARQARYRK